VENVPGVLTSKEDSHDMPNVNIEANQGKEGKRKKERMIGQVIP